LSDEVEGLSRSDTKVILGSFLVVLLGLSAALYATFFMVPPSPPQETASYATSWELFAANIKFNDTNPTIYVPLHQVVVLTIVNRDGVPHTWDVDALNIHTGIINPGETKVVRFTVDVAGTYRYYCSIHPGLMDGNLVAQAPTS